MKKLLSMTFFGAFLCLCLTQGQNLVHANDRDDLYAVILSPQPKLNKQSNLKNIRTSSRRSNSVVREIGGSDNLRSLVRQIAQQNGVPPHIAHGVVMAESRYNCGAHNRSGASGIMQVLPKTARSLGVSGSLRSCATGLQAGMRYLKLALNRGGYGCSGVSLYERGVYARPSCTAYGRRVMAYASQA